MSINELDEIIRDTGLDKYYRYNINGSPIRSDEVGFIINNDKWSVYQSYERGGYNIVESFNNESDACQYLLSILKMHKRMRENYQKFKSNQMGKSRLDE